VPPDREAIERAAEIVHAAMPPTPQYRWPMLGERLGAEVWVKHENHTPVGAFKIRGGLVFFDDLARSGRRPKGVIAATRGNHGQSVAFAAGRYGIPATIVVPQGNSAEKNAVMRALGAELIEHGEDFQASLEFAEVVAAERSLLMVPSFHPLLVAGVATCGMELLGAAPDLKVVYVPIGLGSGICGMLAAREALGLRTEVVGVVSAHAPAYARSFAQRQSVEAPAETQLADGMACRMPQTAALEIIWRGVERIVEVTDEEVAAAMRLMFECTHNVCEGAGAAALAAAAKERSQIAGRKVAVVATGGNVDSDVFAAVLRGERCPTEDER
jgi:threonine dehydratase